MSRFYAFNFSPNPPVDLSGRVFTVKDVGPLTPVTLVTSSVAGNVTYLECELPDNRMCEATLVDTRNGVELPATVLKFNTDSNNLFGKSGEISIYTMEEASSSSSTSSLSSSSSSSTSSNSSSTSSLSSSSSSTSSLSSSSSSSTSSLSSSSTSSLSSSSSSSSSNSSSSSS